ncbi:uncharacterized protein BKA78DRAFT_294646 [Phyllosticta capitalensis]|uniref:uncharacterized protein n=1 Tax=Phyllosticta capitalensis TaxID=121624 RepID=UPI00312F13A6
MAAANHSPCWLLDLRYACTSDGLHLSAAIKTNHTTGAGGSSSKPPPLTTQKQDADLLPIASYCSQPYLCQSISAHFEDRVPCGCLQYTRLHPPPVQGPCQSSRPNSFCALPPRVRETVPSKPLPPPTYMLVSLTAHLWLLPTSRRGGDDCVARPSGPTGAPYMASLYRQASKARRRMSWKCG